MAEKRVSVRLAAVGGKQVRAELEGVGGAATRGFRYAGPVRFAGWDGEAPISESVERRFTISRRVRRCEAALGRVVVPSVSARVMVTDHGSPATCNCATANVSFKNKPPVEKDILYFGGGLCS